MTFIELIHAHPVATVLIIFLVCAAVSEVACNWGNK